MGNHGPYEQWLRVLVETAVSDALTVANCKELRATLDKAACSIFPKANDFTRDCLTTLMEALRWNEVSVDPLVLQTRRYIKLDPERSNNRLKRTARSPLAEDLFGKRLSVADVTRIVCELLIEATMGTLVTHLPSSERQREVLPNRDRESLSKLVIFRILGDPKKPQNGGVINTGKCRQDALHAANTQLTLSCREDNEQTASHVGEAMYERDQGCPLSYVVAAEEEALKEALIRILTVLAPLVLPKLQLFLFRVWVSSPPLKSAGVDRETLPRV